MTRHLALTGGIATGKSTACSLFSTYGAVILDADAAVHDLYRNDREFTSELIDHFGNAILDTDGMINRKRLGAIVFADPRERSFLEGVSHPRVREALAEKELAALASNPQAIIHDIPLLYESRLEEGFEGVILVYAPESLQLERLMARDDLDEKSARSRLAAQMPIDKKREKANWCVDNSGTLGDLAIEVDLLWNRLTS